MSLRDWLVLFGVLTVLIIIVDAIRRIWLERRRANELNFGLKELDISKAEGIYGSELPNGGARVVNSTKNNVKSNEENIPLDIPENNQNNLSQINTKYGNDSGNDEDLVSEQNNIASDIFFHPSNVGGDKNRFEQQIQSENVSTQLPDSLNSKQTQDHTAHKLNSEAAYIEASVGKAPEITGRVAAEASTPKNTIVVLNLVSEQKAYHGQTLLDFFSKEGLIFGDMNLFHKYVNKEDPRNGIVFSVANGVEPGVFNLTNFKESEFIALSFFMVLPNELPAMDAFKSMIKTAQRIANAMGGVLKDDKHQIMTQETLEVYRKRVSVYQKHSKKNSNHSKKHKNCKHSILYFKHSSVFYILILQLR